MRDYVTRRHKEKKERDKILKAFQKKVKTTINFSLN